MAIDTPTIGATDTSMPRIESVPDIDEMAFDQAVKTYDSMMNHIDRSMIGKWFGMPPDRAPERGYCYTRAGLKGKAMTMERGMTLRAYGWRPAPPGTKCGGFLMDGENGEYWYARIDVYRKMKEHQEKARKEKFARTIGRMLKNPTAEILDGEDGDELRKHGVTVEVSDVETGSATFDEIQEKQRQEKLRARRKGA